MMDFSYITQSHPGYIENLYQDFVKNPLSVDPDLRKFFEGFDFAYSHYAASGNAEAFHPKEFFVWNLIHQYRRKGHLIANTNPVRHRKNRNENLDLDDFEEFSESELNENEHENMNEKNHDSEQNNIIKKNVNNNNKHLIRFAFNKKHK